MTDRFRPNMIESATEREEYYRLKREEKALIEKLAACKRLKALERTGSRLKTVVVLRYFHELTLEEVGERMGLTRERVRQMEEIAKDAIRHHPRAGELASLWEEVRTIHRPKGGFQFNDF